MAISPFDSTLYRDLFTDPELRPLFSDSAELRAMLLVEGTLARVQGELGLIPRESGEFIHRASLEIQLDPAALAAETARSGVCVPALVSAFRQAMDAPEHAQYVHWGATSQDITDTALILRLKRALERLDARIVTLIRALGRLAERHATLAMPARTWGQYATPTTLGAVVAAWGQPLLRHRLRLVELTPRLLRPSLSGAAGTLSAMGEKGPEVARALAATLGLEPPGSNWHSARDTIAELSGWCSGLCGSLGKMGEDLLLLTRSETGEVTLAQAGSSSTMPQKSNPVLPALLVTLARFTAAQQGAVLAALPHREQRDGAAWMLEWLALGPIVMATGRALHAADDLAGGLQPSEKAMRAHLEADGGAMMAEALSFALAGKMPRPAAQKAVRALAEKAKSENRPFRDLAREAWPGLAGDTFLAPVAQLGQAPQEARDFARIARTV